MKNPRLACSKRTFRSLKKLSTGTGFGGCRRLVIYAAIFISSVVVVANSFAEDYVVRGTLKTRYTDAEYTLCLLDNGKMTASESSSISSPFGSMASNCRGSGTWRSTRYEDWTLMTGKVSGKQSGYGSTGSTSGYWSFDYRIEATDDGWFLVLPTKTVKLINIGNTDEGKRILKNARR